MNNWKMGNILVKRRKIQMPNIKFDIVKNIGTLSEGSRGWKKEVNIVSWNDRKAKIDIRDWDEKHEKMGKGITLDKEEISELRDLLNRIDIDELDVE
jgi:hypothetical protein